MKFEKLWTGNIVEHKGFRDLGNYVIELPEYTDHTLAEQALPISNMIADHGFKFGCTAMGKRNSKGEVVIGRNMDLDISQNPAYVFKTSIGKYKNVCVSYSPGFYLPYSEVQKLDTLDENILKLIPYQACDCMNEKGLYIEVNLREKNEKLACYGLHSSRGEKARADGTPWSELRACLVAVCQLVSQNCATVQEAVEYLNNSYDWYAIAPAPGVSMAVSENNLCYYIGDATGEYGLIEFGQDEIHYLPYQYGQANYYITPKWNALDVYGAGVGRLQTVSRVIRPVETLEQAMDAMKPIMWRNETLWIGESKRVTDGTRLHPYNQLLFQDDKGNPQMDWRGEYVYMWPVLDDGRMLIAADMYEQAKKSTYDPKIRQYYDDAVATGRLIIDDGSITFPVNGKQVNLDELFAKYSEYEASGDLEKRAELKPYYDVYWHLRINLTDAWAHDDYNFEAMKASAYAKLHIRYNAEGGFDPSGMSKYEKLRAFYGYGTEKDEKPLRDDGEIWTTSLNVGANCAEKRIKIRFWEDDNVIFEAGF